MPAETSYEFVRVATYNLLKRKLLKVCNLEKLIAAKEATYLKKPLLPFVFQASVSVVPPDDPIDWKFQGTEIRFEKKPARHDEEYPEASPKYATQVELKVEARCELSAAGIAISRLTIVKAVANLLVNVETTHADIFKVGSIKGKNAINQIRLSHGIILDSTKRRLLPTVSFPLQHGPQTDESFLIDKQLLGRINKRLKTLESVENDIQLPLKETLRRYDRALDNDNLNSVLSGLWGAIEPICGSYEGRFMIKRMLRVISGNETEYHRHVLNRCHAMRNSIAHTNSKMRSPLNHVFDMMRYVELLLEFMFSHHTKFGSYKKFISFLDSSPQEAIDRRDSAQAELDFWSDSELMPEDQKPLLISSKGYKCGDVSIKRDTDNP